jgi:folate-binding protein YgfZ
MAEALFGAADATVWRAKGARSLSFLHDMLTQDLDGLAPGRGALATLLTSKGRIRAVVRVLAEEGGALLLADEAAAPAIADDVARVAPLAGVEVADLSARWRLLRVLGDAGRVLGVPLPEGEHCWVAVDDAIVVRTVWGGAGADVLVPPEAEESWRARLLAGGARAARAGELEAARIAEGRPVVGLDVGEGVLVNETSLIERAVSFTKGCYPGQESVARVRSLGSVRRRLVVLRLSSGPPSSGATVAADGMDVGHVTSAAATDGGAVALAIVRAHVTAGAIVRVGDAAATIAG